MAKTIDVDVWVRGTNQAETETLVGVPADPAWSDGDVRTLLTEMLLALERTRNSGGEPPPVALRGSAGSSVPAPTACSCTSR